MASAYPDEPSLARREACESLARALPEMLPCGACGINLQLELALRDVHEACASADKLCDFWCQIHNDVNQRLGKPCMDCKDAREEYRTVPVCNREIFD